VPKNVLATISARRVSADEVARQWLVKFAEICQREVTPQLSAIWANQLSDLAPDLLDHACDRLAKVWTSTFLPTPGAVRAQIDNASARASELNAEIEWQNLLAWIHENFFPDTGIRRNAPQLSPAVLHAARTAGGFAFLERCRQEDLVFARRTFLAARRNFHETGQAAHLLGDSEAKRILQRLETAQRPTLVAKTTMPGEDLPRTAELKCAD
jgi:hypothetical protein